jgi:hypothetical protein
LWESNCWLEHDHPYGLQFTGMKKKEFSVDTWKFLDVDNHKSRCDGFTNQLKWFFYFAKTTWSIAYKFAQCSNSPWSNLCLFYHHVNIFGFPSRNSLAEHVYLQCTLVEHLKSRLCLTIIVAGDEDIISLVFKKYRLV